MLFACPNCRDRSLETVKVAGCPVEVDHCQSCGGLWLDQDKLKQLLDIPEASLLIPREAALGRKRCPGCARAMYAFYYPRTFVTVDMCIRCRGIWLDRNEFQEMDAVLAFAARMSRAGDGSDGTRDRMTMKERLLEFIEVNISAYKFWA